MWLQFKAGGIFDQRQLLRFEDNKYSRALQVFIHGQF